MAQSAHDHALRIRTHLSRRTTLEPSFTCLDVFDIFDRDGAAHHVKAEVRTLAGRWLGHIERHLDDRAWIASDEFTVADIMMAGVLRAVRRTALMQPFPKITSYYQRCFARPAWQRALELYAERGGVSIEDIR